MKIFVAVFGGLGLILLAIAGYVYYREANFLSTAETATGIVTDYDLSSSDDGGNTFCPVVDFFTNAGEAVEYHANVCSSPPSYELNDSVEVLYDPREITHVQLKGFWSQYTGVVVLGGIGLPFFLLGVWGLFVGRKKASTQSS